MATSRFIECLGGPLCGSQVPDSNELWMAIANVNDPSEQHYYKRLKMVDVLRGRSVLVWHYHGHSPEGPGVPLLRPHPRKFK